MSVFDIQLLVGQKISRVESTSYRILLEFSDNTAVSISLAHNPDGLEVKRAKVKTELEIQLDQLDSSDQRRLLEWAVKNNKTMSIDTITEWRNGRAR